MKFKTSDYNYFVKYNNSIIGMNLILKRPFILNEYNSSIFDKFKDNLCALEKGNINLFNAFLKFGIIVNKSVSEIELIKSMNHDAIYNNGVFRLTINPTLNCNLSCWYCYETHPKTIINSKVIKSIENQIQKIVELDNVQKLELDWFGGEPMLCFSNILYPLALRAKGMALQNNVQFESSITTNGYLIKHEMISKFKEISLNNFQITLDGDAETHNSIRKHNRTHDTYNKIVKNINLLCEHIPSLRLVLRINYTPDNLANICQIIKDFPLSNRNKITISFQKVWQIKNNDFDDIKELEKLKDTFIEAGFRWGNMYFNDKNYTCYADLHNQAVVNFDGKIFKCTARDFCTTQNDGVIDDDGIKWHKDLLDKRMKHSTFDNQFCLPCKLLPACYGPCSQKLMELSHIGDFSRICLKEGIEIGITTFLERFYNQVVD